MSEHKALRGRPTARLNWRDGEPFSTQFQDGYFSRQGGAQESQHVFFHGNRLPLRWATSERFTVVETGFGTGLNLLTTWTEWRKAGRPCRLHYLSIEGYPLRPADLATALSAWPELRQEADTLIQQYPPPLPGLHRLLLDEGQLCLDLLLGPLEEAIETLCTLPDLLVDAWYLDGFAPSRNPEMWTEHLFKTMASISAQDATVATYSAAGAVRRGLTAAGFDVSRAPGYGNKREMLTARLQQVPASAPLQATPWQLPAHRFSHAAQGKLTSHGHPGRIAVVGAGLAGAATAEALARRGHDVTVYEANEVASAASGNSQGALYTRISHQASPLSLFALLSFCFASRRYRGLLQQGCLADGELCGLLQMQTAVEKDDPLRDTLASLPDLVREVSASDAASLTGLPQCAGGLFFPGSGWMHPGTVCDTLLQHPRITLRCHTGNLSLHQQEQGWRLLGSDGELVGEAATVIVACGIATAALCNIDWLELQAIRGQTTEIPSTGALASLATVICHDGYLPPARLGAHCIGATFDLEDAGSEVRPVDHVRNIQQLAKALPELESALPGTETAANLVGHASHRCASRDYLPVVGPVPDAARFCEDYATLRRNARKPILCAGAYVPGLYINTAHGARGLTSTPLSAELLAAQVCGDTWPLPAKLAEALAPGRFLIRDLMRGQR